MLLLPLPLTAFFREEKKNNSVLPRLRKKRGGLFLSQLINSGRGSKTRIRGGKNAGPVLASTDIIQLGDY